MKRGKLYRLGAATLFSMVLSLSFSSTTNAANFKSIQDKAQHGDVTAQYNMGSIYAIGEGVPQNYDQAFNWFEKAAKQGHIKSAHNIALLYEKGRGAPQDYNQAVNWYKRAVSAGYADSQLNLGVMYAKGLGVERDTSKAIELFKMIKTEGNTKEKAKYNLNLIYAKNYQFK